MKKLILGAALSAASLLTLASTAQAQNYQASKAGSWLVDVRGSGIMPTANDGINTSAGAATGLHVHVNDDYKPTLGITYFFTDHVSAELVLGTSQHDIRAQGPGTDVLVRKTWVLPPVLTVQYRPAPASRLNPYVGAGINYMLFYSGSNENGFKVKTPSGLGWALQAGADVALVGPWTLNGDVKKVFFETDAKINGGALNSKVNLDPWVVSLGLGRKF